jgi:mRNA interferase RelE/StbE
VPKKHKISFTNRAAGDLDDLSDREYEKIVKACLRLEADPSPDSKHVKKLQGYKDLFRLSVGDYRVVFQWQGSDVIVIRALTRQDFGKRF